jgi:DNA-binding transcriptional ArsR family regulator
MQCLGDEQGSPIRPQRPLVSAQRAMRRDATSSGAAQCSHPLDKYMSISEYLETMARSPATSDVFNAVGEVRRREILDALIAGEKAVGAIVDDLSLSQPQVSKHLRVLSEVGLVSWRAEGRRRLYRLEPSRLLPFHEWLAKYEQALNDRLDRMDDYLRDLQRKGEPQ